MMRHCSFSRNRSQRFFLLGLLLALSCGLTGPVMAEDGLGAMEQSLFSTTYPDQSRAQRLERLESSIFGEPQTGAESEREARLKQVLSNVRQKLPVGVEPERVPDQARESAPAFTEQVPHSPPAVVQGEPDATSYPTVTALERQVFGRDFIRDDLDRRLERLEKKVDGQSSPQMGLADRVDKLLARYPHLKPSGSVPQMVNVSPALQNLPDDPSQFAGNSRDIYTKLDALERHQLNGKTYPNALLTERLDRLEKKAFNRTHSGESIDSRISRLLGQYQAGTVASSTNGAVPRPDFQERQPYQPSGRMPQVITPSTGHVASPQNIQIGGGFSSNSSSSYNFSPEMMSMLPPNVRSQVSSGQGGGTVARAPGSVVIERQTYNSPGFQTYGGAPIQHYNYYGAPGTQVQSQSTTTVIQPNGSQEVYGYPGNGAASGHPNGLPTPAYVGDPALLQAINQLETHVFGQVNTVEPVPIRLGKLETELLGQMYVSLPEQQRLDNLEKAYRMKAVSKLLEQNKGSNMGRGSGGFYLGVPLGPGSFGPMGAPGAAIPISPGVFGW